MHVTTGMCASCLKESCESKQNGVKNCNTYEAGRSVGDLRMDIEKAKKEMEALKVEFEAYKQANPPKRKPGRPKSSS